MKFIIVTILLLVLIKCYSQTTTFNNIIFDTLPNLVLNIEVLDSGYALIGATAFTNFDRYVIIKFVDNNGIYKWKKLFGEVNIKYWGGTQNSFIKTYDNGYVLAGQKVNLQTGKNAVLLMKFNQYFDTVWTKTYLTDTLFVASYQCVQADDGGFALVGTIQKPPSSSLPKTLLIKIDSMGNMLWHKEFSYPTYQAFNITKSYDGGFVIGGMSTNDDWGLIKTDSLGNQKWIKTIGNPNWDDSRVMGLITTKDSCYIITGPYGINKINYENVYKSHIVKINNNGDIIWDKIYYETYFPNNHPIGDTIYSYFNSVIETDDGSLYATGVKQHNNTNVYSKLYKFNSSGDTIWSREFPLQAYFAYLETLKSTSDGGFILAGWGDTFYYSPTQQAWLVKTNCIGFDSQPLADYSFIVDSNNITLNNLSQKVDSCIWDFGDGSPLLYSHICDSVSHIYADTGSYSVSLIAYNGCTIADNDTITKQIIIGTSKIDDINFNNSELSIYPNPSSGQLTIKTTTEAIEAIEVFNCIGSKIDEIIVKAIYNSYIYNSKNLNGLYFIKVKTKVNVYTTKVIFQ
ncbi:MAG: hypothetical protein A2033_15260 [Bacteroidetes bacterium GWA2_31_9]|nr:MAG: hypothetical protein A2033_15260 [Bacteroidetes bacterium GWA2_31_9]